MTEEVGRQIISSPGIGEISTAQLSNSDVTGAAEQQQENDREPPVAIDIDTTEDQSGTGMQQMGQFSHHNVQLAEQMMKAQTFACLYGAPVALMIAVVLGGPRVGEWDHHCDAVLQLWLLGVGILQMIRLPFRLLLVRRLMLYIDSQAGDDHFQTCLNEVKHSISSHALYCLNILSLLWYPLGMVEIIRSDDCEAKAPNTFKLSLALVIVFLVFLGLSCTCRLLYICLFHEMLPPVLQEGQISSAPNAGASEDVLQEILLATFVEGSDSNPPTKQNNACVICLEEFREGDRVATLPCRHCFHSNEIMRWLKDKRTCPLCNSEVTLQSLQENRKT